MEDGPPIFGQDSTCPALLFPDLVPPAPFRVRGYHPLWPHFPERSTKAQAKDWRLLRVRSPLLAESRLISVPPGTEMFQFPGFASAPYEFRCRYLPTAGGFPHSDIPGSKPVCRLPEAYRRLPRPSSPVAAKASTVCAYSLDHITLSSLGLYQLLDHKCNIPIR